MEEREQQYIAKYLPQLIECTVCDGNLLKKLQDAGILSGQDRQKLEAYGRKVDVKFQAFQLYELLYLTKPGSYDPLLSALSELNQSSAATILANGKERNFDLSLGNDKNDPIVQATLNFISPPERLRDLLENEKLPVLVISTDDIIMTTNRIQAEKIQHQYHLFSSKEKLIQAFGTVPKETAMLIAMHGMKMKALEDVLRSIRDKMPTDKRMQCIVMTTENKETVGKLTEEFNSGSSKFCDVIHDDLKWNQLSREFQESLLGRRVQFQDQEISLTDLLCSCSEVEKQRLLEKLETKLLVQLINDEKPIVCKNTLLQRPTPPYYIHRKIISRSCAISDEILQNGNSRPNTSFAITGMMRPALVSLMAGTVSKSEEQIRPRSRTAQGITAKFVLLDKPEHFTALCNKINPETPAPVKNLHWLNFNKERGHLEWVRSFGEPGCLSLVQQYLLPMADKRESYSLLEQDFITDLVQQEAGVKSRPAICISDHPGMGKTTLMAHIGEQLLTRDRGQSTSPSPHPKFVQYFVMTELMRDLEEKGISEERRLNKAVILEVLLNRITDSQVVRYLFQKGGTKCDLMLDGFDEVLPHQTKMAIKFISIVRHEFSSKDSGPTFRLWLTTRPIYLQLVEQTLGVLGYNMLPFDENDQREFLKTYWTQAAGRNKILLDPERLEIFTQGSLKTMQRVSKSLSQFETEMTGVPLQCLLLAQVSEGSVNYECSVGDFNVEEEDPDKLVIKNMADLYSRVMDKKLEIFLNRESSNSHLESHLSKNNKQVMKRIHMKLALELLLPEWAKEFEVLFLHEANISPEELSIYGFITEYSIPNQPVFVHRTYAEYFVALFAVEIGTCERLTEGFRVTNQMAQFYLDGILATSPEVIEMRHPDYPELASFQMPVVTYFVEELLEMRMAEAPIPRCLLDSVRGNFKEIAPAGMVDMKSSKILACVTNDRMYICKLLVDSLDEDGKQVWLERSTNFHAEMVYAAAMKGNREGLEMICTLLEEWSNQQIADLPFENEKAKNPVLAAVNAGNVESVEYLILEKGFKSQVWGNARLKILHQCVNRTDGNSQRDIENRQNIIHFLVANQGPVNAANIHETSILEHLDNVSWTPLLADEVHIKLRMALIEAGADIQAYDEGTNQVLHRLGDFRGITPEVYHEFVQQIESVVLDTVSDPEERCYIFKNTSANPPYMYTPNWHWGSDTALHLAVGHLEVLNETLDLFNKYRFNWNEGNDDGYTLLHVAVKYGRSMRLIQKLVEVGADWTVTNEEGRTAFHEAAWAGHVDFLRWICGLGRDRPDFDIDLRDDKERTALHYAMRAPEDKRRQTVHVLIRNGADPNLLSEADGTPLIYSLDEKHGIDVELLRYLKENGANILGDGEDDKTEVINSLYSMANKELDQKWDLCSTVEYLITEGANLMGRENKPNLVHHAAANGWLQGLQLLERHLGRNGFIQLATSPDDYGHTPVYNAIQKGGGVELLQWLINIVGENVAGEACGEGGMKPLHACAKAGWVEGMELLLDRYRVDVMCKDDEGNTALHMAHCTDGMKIPTVNYLREKMGDEGEQVTNQNGETPEQYGERMIEEYSSQFADFW